MPGQSAIGGAAIGGAASGGSSAPPTGVESVQFGDTAAAANRATLALAEGLTLEEIGALYRGVFALSGDGFQIEDAIAFLRGVVGNVTETAQFGALVTYRQFTLLTLLDNMRVISDAQAVQGRGVVVTESAEFASVATVLQGLLIVERLRVVGQALGNARFGAYLADITRLVDQVRSGLPAAILDGLNISSELTAQRAILMLEAIKLRPVLVGQAAHNVTIAQVMRLRDSLARFYGAEIDEYTAFGDALTSAALHAAKITEGTVVGGSVAPQLLLSVTASDKVNVTPAQIVQMIFEPTVLEGVDITAGYVAPDGSLVTWVMNTRTGALTEYGNYGFNSFAQVGDRYLGASDQGLFELLGDDDAGTSIIARIRGGYLQFGGTQLSRLKEAYIAARGEGDWVLQIRTADGVVYNYGVTNRSMRSTKVHMGKGQRSRYFAFELVSAGQDFDLDTLEFVPIVVQRRV